MGQAKAPTVESGSWRWTVDGVSPAAQDAARNAARAAEISLGQWLEAAIIRAVEQPQKSGPADDPRPSRRYF